MKDPEFLQESLCCGVPWAAHLPGTNVLEVAVLNGLV